MPRSPAAPVSVRTKAGRPVITEGTGKQYKALQLAGAVAIIVGVVSCAADNPSSGGWFGLVCLIGAGLYAFGRFGAWWNHG
jgi:hypothetical protein